MNTTSNDPQTLQANLLQCSPVYHRPSHSPLMRLVKVVTKALIKANYEKHILVIYMIQNVVFHSSLLSWNIQSFWNWRMITINT